MLEGLIKSPSVPLEAGLRALLGGDTLRLPDIGREASRPYNRNHRSGDFLRVHHAAT